jgi:hypothetical protein
MWSSLRDRDISATSRHPAHIVHSAQLTLLIGCPAANRTLKATIACEKSSADFRPSQNIVAEKLDGHDVHINVRHGRMHMQSIFFILVPTPDSVALSLVSLCRGLYHINSTRS